MKKKSSSSRSSNSLLSFLLFVSSSDGGFGFVQNDGTVTTLKKIVRNCHFPLLAVSNSKASWSVTDDWESLSSENPLNSGPDGADLFNQDLAMNAAAQMGSQQQQQQQQQPTEEDIWVDGAIEEIQNAYNLPTENEFMNVPLYDTEDANDDDTTVSTAISYEDEMGTEIAMLVRCNENPEEINIEQGRAVRELTIQQKNDVSQLVSMEEQTTTASLQPTPFFRDSIRTIFRAHAKKKAATQQNKKDVAAAADDDDEKGDDNLQMDAPCVAKWMQQSIGPGSAIIGQHDKRVRKTISKYGKYGTGVLTEQDLQTLYFQVIVGEQDNKKNQKEKDEDQQSPSLLLRNLMRRQSYINAVWRDIRNHGILSPKEQEREQQQQTLMMQQQKQQHQIENNNNFDETLVMDECEIMEWDEQFSQENSNRKSSHLDVELATDNKTPVWIRDGEFVFIDEESCIGCKQCVAVSPSSFLMLENSGRARSYQQRNGVDVSMAVDTCPVSCMHFVSFSELKKFESARDQGDGRDDHKHLGKQHTPLYVSGMDSDANHKSSWHHYLRNKCYISGDCPKAGCYDCPYYKSPGGNPQFQKKLKHAEHVRAEHFKKTGVADMWRKMEDL